MREMLGVGSRGRVHVAGEPGGQGRGPLLHPQLHHRRPGPPHRGHTQVGSYVQKVKMAPAIQNFDTKIRSQTAKNTLPKNQDYAPETQISLPKTKITLLKTKITLPKTKITLLKPKLRSQKLRLRSEKNISGNLIAELPAFYTYVTSRQQNSKKKVYILVFFKKYANKF